jgi:hypothetical protein
MASPLYPATEDLTSSEESAMLCRICLGDDEPAAMVAPCRCRGTSKWVHRFCLDEWRAQERVPLAFTHCSVCREAYEFEPVELRSEQAQKLKFGLLVTRDMFVFFLVVQSTIAGVAILMHAVDRWINCPEGGSWSIPCNATIPKLYPQGWSQDRSLSHMSIGPYYVTSFFLLLALLGLVASGLYCCGRLPQAPAPAVSSNWRHDVRHSACLTHEAAGVRRRPPAPNRTRGGARTGNGVDCGPCDCGGCYGCADCCEVCVRCCAEISGGSTRSGSGRSSNCNCNGCNCSGGADCGEAGAVIPMVALALLLVFVIIGVIVGIFFATVLFQRIVQSHIHLLHMRGEAKRYTVKDLSRGEQVSHATARAGSSTPPPVPQVVVRCA